jgi:hypothetical protein
LSGHGSAKKAESETERERNFLAGKIDSVFLINPAVIAVVICK